MDLELPTSISIHSKVAHAQPFLKWAGGKRWFIQEHSDLLPTNFRKYLEPFLGSAAVFFTLRPKNALLSDTNKELIYTYQAIADNWQEVQVRLDAHQESHCKEYYYKIRHHKSCNIYEKAAQFIYLNRTCWNGLYRVNLKGQFNVPIGTKKNVILNTDNFEEIAKLLEHVTIMATDFETSLQMAGDGDFVFVDPPYTVKHNHNGFIKYNESLFSWDDQIRLRNCLIDATERGAIVLATNADHPSVRDLYDDYFEIVRVSRKSVIAADPSKRGHYEEIIIRSKF